MKRDEASKLKKGSREDLFSQIKDSLLAIDPVAFCENYLTLDGRPFRLNGNGYKPFADIYRYIGIKALERDAKPVVLVKGRQVGATTMAAALEMFFVASGLFGTANRPPIRIMHCFPQLEVAYAYTKTKLNSMISSAKPYNKDGNKFDAKDNKTFLQAKLDMSTSSNDSLQFKQFVGGNHIWIESTGLNADRLRGRTIDVMFFDEIQDMRGAALGNATKTLAKAQYGRIGEGIQVYFGTPKQRGTEYWKIWNISSQQYFHLGCGKCNEVFPLYGPNCDWEKIWLHGYIVKCTHCGHEQDKREAAERGRWVSFNENEDTSFVGYHINQLYMPEFTKEKIISQKPENHPINTERAYQNEVLGEFFSGDASPITPEQIDQHCADRERKFRASISFSENKNVYLGCDWGQKVDIDQSAVGETRTQQGQSYSCVVVLVADGPHILSIDFASRLKRNDFESKKSIIEQVYRQYSIKLGVGDIGFAHDLTEVLQREFGNKFLGSQAVSRLNGHVKFKTDFFPNTIMFERDYYIAELYDLMKQGKIRFPFGDYEKVAWLIQHCCSMEIKPKVDRAGYTGIRYVKGSSPNDGFMALLNAYLAFKFDITNGFTIHNPQLIDQNAAKRGPSIPAVLGYMPQMDAVKR